MSGIEVIFPRTVKISIEILKLSDKEKSGSSSTSLDTALNWVSLGLKETPKSAHSYYVQLSLLSLMTLTQVVHLSNCGIIYRVNIEIKALLYGTIYLSIL